MEKRTIAQYDGGFEAADPITRRRDSMEFCGALDVWLWRRRGTVVWRNDRVERFRTVFLSDEKAPGENLKNRIIRKT